MRESVISTYFPELSQFNVTAATTGIPRANQGKVPIWQTVLNLIGLVKVRDLHQEQTIGITASEFIVVTKAAEDGNMGSGVSEGDNFLKRYEFSKIRDMKASPGKHTATDISFSYEGKQEKFSVWANLNQGVAPEQSTYEGIFPELQAMTKEIASRFG